MLYFCNLVKSPPASRKTCTQLLQSNEDDNDDTGMFLHMITFIQSELVTSCYLGGGGISDSDSTVTSYTRVDADMRQNVDLQPSIDTQGDIDWTQAARSYPNVDEAPSFISQQRQAAGQHVFTTTANPANLQVKQLQAYTIVQQHPSATSPPPLRMIVSGTAGTGKSYLIHCLRLLLQHQLMVAAPTGVAAFNINIATPSTPSSAYPPEESSSIWRERDSPDSSRHSQR